MDSYLPKIGIYHKCPKQAERLRKSGRPLEDVSRWVSTHETYAHKYRCHSCAGYAPSRITAAYKLMLKM